MILQELTQEFTHCLKQAKKSLLPDFTALRTWLQICLAAVLFAVSAWHQKEQLQTNSRVSRVEETVYKVRDSLRIVTRYQQAEVKQIRAQVTELTLAGVQREKAIQQLVALLAANGITEKEALKRIEKLNQTQLAQFFSTIKE
jgi:hypothetical protein